LPPPEELPSQATWNTASIAPAVKYPTVVIPAKAGIQK